MSGIAGVWNFGGAPLDPSLLARMAATLRHRGPDGEGQHVAGSVGFAHLRMWVTPEEVGEIQPILAPGGVLLVFDGRIDNRDELQGFLDLPAGASDATCVLAAYQRWQGAFVERLNGDFALALFDPRHSWLLLARDAMGVRPLYYHQGKGFVAFASEIKALLVHPEVPARPDDDGLADFLMLGSRPLDRQDVTCFAGISAVVASHVVTVTPDRLTSRRYWDFDTGCTLRLGSFEEYVEAFRVRFVEAVRRRTRAARPVAISVSGGLDSSSIFCQAERLRREREPQTPDLIGISYTGPAGSDADEQRYLLDIEREYGVEIARIPMEPLRGVVRGAEDQIRAIEAPFMDYAWGVTRAVQLTAQGRGARTLLMGLWGDQVLFSSAYLVDLFRHFAWGEISKHIREYRRWLGVEGARELTRRFAMDLVRRSVPDFLVPPLKALRRRLLPPPRVGPWFAQRFLERALRFANRRAKIGEGFHSAHAASIYLEARSKYHVHCMEWNNKIAALHGLDVALPFLDRDLVAFLMAVPGEIQARGGVPRVLLREGLRGVLPDTIRARTWKASFTGTVNSGVAQDLPAITRALTASSLGVRLGYLDGDRLAGEVTRLAGCLTGPDAVEAWELADMFGLEVWLQVFLNRFDGHLSATPSDPRLEEEAVWAR